MGRSIISSRTSRSSWHRGWYYACVVALFALYIFVIKVFWSGHLLSLPRTRKLSRRPRADDHDEKPSSSASTDGVVVLGMHRSGTSMCTGLLERMGLHLGAPHELLGPQEGENDKGFFERLDVVHINDEVMREQDVHWSLNVYKFDHLRALKAVLNQAVSFEEGERAVNFFTSTPNVPWALKDPRLCITLRFWMPFWRTPPAVLFVYRHPVEVGNSLVRRKEFGLARALHLWIAYNRVAIQNSSGLCRVILSDAALMKGPHEEMQRVHHELRACGVDVPRMASKDDIADFVSPDLRHSHQAQYDARGVNKNCLSLPPWESSTVGRQREREAAAYNHAMRVYCAIEDRTAFRPDFRWESLPDYSPP